MATGTAGDPDESDGRGDSHAHRKRMVRTNPKRAFEAAEAKAAMAA